MHGRKKKEKEDRRLPAWFGWMEKKSAGEKKTKKKGWDRKSSGNQWLQNVKKRHTQCGIAPKQIGLTEMQVKLEILQWLNETKHTRRGHKTRQEKKKKEKKRGKKKLCVVTNRKGKKSVQKKVDTSKQKEKKKKLKKEEEKRHVSSNLRLRSTIGPTTRSGHLNWRKNWANWGDFSIPDSIEPCRGCRHSVLFCGRCASFPINVLNKTIGSQQLLATKTFSESPMLHFMSSEEYFTSMRGSRWRKRRCLAGIWDTCMICTLAAVNSSSIDRQIFNNWLKENKK